MPPARPLLLNELTREDARTIAPEAVALFPVGATEQHGPHLPVGTDTFAVEAIARRAAALAANRAKVVVTPTLPFGSSHHHLPFGGTMSLGTETYYRLILDLTESLIVGGFRRIFILNGHGGNHELIQLVARDLALKHPVQIGAGSYWHIARQALAATAAGRLDRVPGHAGAFETSLVLHLRPELVREPRPGRDGDAWPVARGTDLGYRLEINGSWQRIDGFTDSPALATAELGGEAIEAVAGAVAEALIALAVRSG
jgi:creatinine amidohydrolase